MSRVSFQTRQNTVQLQAAGIKLEYSLMTPNALVSSQQQQAGSDSSHFDSVSRLAICLHPWSWLGGCMTDPVLQLVTRPLIDAGYVVLKYNSRGVGKSTGRASLTGSSEVEDLKELVQWARTTMPKLSSIVLMGYSYGSLIASMHPVLHDIRISHILLSYPLGPRSWLTAFHGSRYQSAIVDLVRSPGASVLVMHGDEDNFTSVSAYGSWASALQSSHGESELQNGRLEVVKVEGASHFWREEHAVQHLVDTISSWLHTLP